MANYKEENLTGNKWVRCNRIVIENPYVGNKTIQFYEQEILYFSNTDITYKNISSSGPNSLTTTFTPNNSIEIINPYTLEPTGNTFSHEELYVMLFSAYMNEAKKRDE